MIFGMSLSAFTALHVGISLVGIFSGLIVVFGMLRAERLPAWTGLFLVSTVLTSVTGFLFPLKQFGPPHVVGVISLLVLAAVIPALYICRLSGVWRWIYVAGAVLALYLNVFVAVVQAFQKLSFLNALAPTQSEMPFLAAQLLVLVLFLVAGARALRTFRPAFSHMERA